MQADSTTDRRHSSQPPPRANNDAHAPKGVQNHNSNKLPSHPIRKSSSMDRLPHASSDAVQAVTGSSDVPLNCPGKRYGGLEPAGPTRSTSRDNSSHTHAQANMGTLRGSANPHTEFHAARPAVNEMNAPMYQATAAGAPNLRRKAPVLPPAAACSGGDRYSLPSAAHRDEPDMEDQPPRRYQSIRVRPEDQPPMLYNNRPATAQPDVMPHTYQQPGCVGSLARDGTTSPARSQKHRSDMSLMSSPAVQNSSMARLRAVGETRMNVSDPYTLRRPATSAGDSSPDRISAGIDGPGHIASPLAKAPSLSGVLLRCVPQPALIVNWSLVRLGWSSKALCCHCVELSIHSCIVYS